jgi:hypothetical protein
MRTYIHLIDGRQDSADFLDEQIKAAVGTAEGGAAGRATPAAPPAAAD